MSLTFKWKSSLANEFNRLTLTCGAFRNMSLGCEGKVWNSDVFCNLQSSVGALGLRFGPDHTDGVGSGAGWESRL